jgi:ElaB/YqjD/DUF883 family membrane-anchored ribosome-binding protein
MAEALAAREHKPEAAPHASLVDNLESIGQGVKDTWEGATAAVTETGHNVQKAVETTMGAVEGAVEGTAESVGAAVRGTASALGWALNFPAHMRRHPWLLMGGAVVVGLLLGRLVNRRR